MSSSPLENIKSLHDALTHIRSTPPQLFQIYNNRKENSIDSTTLETDYSAAARLHRAEWAQLRVSLIGIPSYSQ